MTPANSGIFGRKSQTECGFYKNPFEFVKRCWHSVVNGRERQTPHLRPGTTLTALTAFRGYEAPLDPGVLRQDDRNPRITRGHPLGPERRKKSAAKGDDEACYRLVAAAPCPAHQAAPIGVSNACYQITSWPSGQTFHCCACRSSSLRNHSAPSCTQRRGQSWPAALGAHHQGQSRQGRRAHRSDLPHNSVRVGENRPISRAGSSSWSSGLILAGRSGLRIHCRNGRRCPVKRGKPAPGVKASRVLRRVKRKWRTKNGHSR